MENHSFSPPRAVPGAAQQPSWQVDVFRVGVDEPIASLVVDHSSLPPRKNRKKILWQLPDAYDVEPRFGDHEKKRLWEMFKQQKKLRRKSSKKGVDAAALPASVGSESGSTDTTVATVADEDPPIATEPSPSPRAKERIAETEPTAKKELPASPPPGFLSDLHISSKKIDRAKESSEATIAGASSLAPTERCGVVSMPPPPPPGLCPLGSAPPMLAASRCFPADSNNIHSPQKFGDLVAQTLMQCLESKSMNIWVEHFARGFHKLLLVGTAQAAPCHTHQDALLQWQTLQQGQWKLQGVCVQPMGGCSSNVDGGASNKLLVVVMSGKTLQGNQTTLSFHQTLILEQQLLSDGYGWRITNEILNLVPTTSP